MRDLRLARMWVSGLRVRRRPKARILEIGREMQRGMEMATITCVDERMRRWWLRVVGGWWARVEDAVNIPAALYNTCQTATLERDAIVSR
jgi:hypothetical protein